MDIYRMKTDDFAAMTERRAGPALAEPCAARLDATVRINCHPGASPQNTLETCDVEMVVLTGPEIAGFIAAHDDCNAAVIADGTHPGLAAEVPGFAVTATVVTPDGADPRAVGLMVSETLDNLGNLRLAAPVLRGLDPAAMGAEGFAVPLHPVAAAALDAACVR